ncbi:MAG: conjugal transfer protein TraF [Proteobacteria bacterium]|nr:conjugal transfer protein TraF [Pseudomonadota bacterium]
MTGNLSYSGPVFYGFNIKYYRGVLAYARSVYANDSTLIDNDIEIDYSNGFGADAGILYYAKKIRLGLTISNIFSRVMWAKHNTARIPTRFNLSLGILPNNYIGGDFEVTKFVTNSPFIFSLGLSGKLRGRGSWYNNLRFSGGIYSISSNFNMDNSIYSFGLGYLAGKFRISTAISGYKTQFSPTFHPEYRVSLSLTQNKEL